MLEDRAVPGDPIHLFAPFPGGLGLVAVSQALMTSGLEIGHGVAEVSTASAATRDLASGRETVFDLLGPCMGRALVGIGRGRSGLVGPERGPGQWIGGAPGTTDLTVASTSRPVASGGAGAAPRMPGPASLSQASYQRMAGPGASSKATTSGTASASSSSASGTTAGSSQAFAALLSSVGQQAEGSRGGSQVAGHGPIGAGVVASSASAIPASTPAPVSPNPAPRPSVPLPLAFEINQGQAASQVQFLAHGAGYELSLAGSMMTIALSAARPSLNTPSATGIDAASLTPPAPDVIQMQFVGANPDVQAVGVGPLPGTANYLIGTNPAQWHTDIPTYGGVELQDLYPGISLRYYSNAGQLEYDWVVSPGADPGAIGMAFQGTEGVTIDPRGDLVLNTPDGAVAEQAPTIYQTIGGVRQSVAGSYMTRPDGSIGLAVGAYDRSQPLTIDPVLTYSTYLGGNGADAGLGIAVNTVGDAYVTGYTQLASGSLDAYVTKLSPNGSLVLYSTYLGGSGITVGTSIAVDRSGSAYVGGYTTAADLPLREPEQPKYGGGTDAFVAKLEPDGNGFVYATYLGGSGNDAAYGIAIDSSDDAVVAGATSSKNFPTENPLQGSEPKGGSDAFVTELDPLGASLVYSTYLGGNSGDSATAVAVDGTGNAYVTGYTAFDGLPHHEWIPTRRKVAAESMRSYPSSLFHCPPA